MVAARRIAPEPERSPPASVGALRELGPRNAVGALIVGGAIALTAAALTLSVVGSWPMWALGQALFAFAFLQWFVILHEAGHGVLFSGRSANAFAGHVASLVAIIPFHAWQPIHQKHHIWTGWQDLDPTTESLVPRTLKVFERSVINVCWRFSIPIFSVIYRINNFWNVPRVLRLLGTDRARRRYLWNLVALCAVYAALAFAVGPRALLGAAGVGVLLGLVLQDPLTLSQHTHVPMRLAGDETAKPFTPAEQVLFTRSLRFPDWFSLLVLLRFDAHELHHELPNVPGWRLGETGRIGATPNSVPWWTWIKRARALPAEVFLFSNRDTSGADV